MKVSRIDVVEYHAKEAVRADISPEVARKHLSAIHYVSDSFHNQSGRYPYERYYRAAKSAGIEPFGAEDFVFEDEAQ